MTKDKDFLGTEPVGKLLLKLAVPTVTAQIINMLYNIVDRIYIGHIADVGALALTGVGVCMPLIMIVSAFAALVGNGGAPRASIFMGSGDDESAEKTLGNCFTLQIIISLILTAVLLIWDRDLLLAFGASANTIEYAVSYMNIYALGTIFVELTLGMNMFITAQGFAKTGMLSVLIGAVCNIVLDPIFIFGFNMGVRGAALATIISQAVSCIWVLHFLFGKKTRLKIKRCYMGLKSRIILPCLALGSSTFIMQATESVISVCFNSSLLAYGGDVAVGAMTILTSVMQFAMLPLQGLGQGAQPIISYNYGAHNARRVKQTYKLLLVSSLSFSVLIWGCVELWPQIFAGMFTSDPALLEFTKTALRIYMASVGLFGIQIACQMTFTSLDKAKESIIVAITRKFILLVPLIYLLPNILPFDKTTSVYLAEPVADLLAVTFTAILFTIQFKKALKDMDDRSKAVLS
ncbi:MAG: MATE family efflux transporter [Eubacteriaceae bacterium]|jgi:putative MATE family efflux protein